MTLIPTEQLRNLLQHGLLSGYWSIAQFNSGLSAHMETILPGWPFLDAHPEFTDMNHRDLEAYRNRTEHTPPAI